MLLAVGALALVPLVIIAVMALPFVGPAVLAGMFTLGGRAGQIESPVEPPASVISGMLA
ncbi:MAG TPA: hypothetical protein VFP84_19490 [Kofleriaceae bacterium]|nr:hypothetical protein [Kofleriaceae bacterium]